jgi:hypothetical protein
MRKIIVVSSNNNPNYYFYSPYIKKSWNYLGWEVCTVVTNDVDPSVIETDHLIILPELEGLRLETQAQAGRLYAANHLPEDAYIMTSDMDLIPLSNYWNPDLDQISVYGFDLTDFTTYPMAYIGMPAQTWKRVMNLSGDSAHDFIRDAKDVQTAYSNDWEQWWQFDQVLITKKLEKFKNQIRFINRGRAVNSPYAFGRIDRGNSMTRIPTPWIDAHCENANPSHPEKLEKFLSIFNEVYAN